jgi:hypothetical protein
MTDVAAARGIRASTLSRRASAPPLKRRGFRLNEFVAMSGMSRATVYRKIKRGAIKVVYIDGMPIIPAAIVDELLGGE